MAIKLHGRESVPHKVEFDMTPMIDCCFQLIIFFMLSLKLFSPEGDFNIKMPLAAPSEGVPDPTQLPPIRVRIAANKNGTMAAMYLADRTLNTFPELHSHIRKVVNDQGGPGSASTAEVELQCDYKLRYENVIKAISAISGYRDGDKLVKLIEKIKFAPPTVAK